MVGLNVAISSVLLSSRLWSANPRMMDGYEFKVITAVVLGGTALEDLDITVDATYCGGRRIQLRYEFTVHLNASHRINILMMGADPVYIDLPINIDLSGRSEVFWK